MEGSTRRCRKTEWIRQELERPIDGWDEGPEDGALLKLGSLEADKLGSHALQEVLYESGYEWITFATVILVDRSRTIGCPFHHDRWYEFQLPSSNLGFEEKVRRRSLVHVWPLLFLKMSSLESSITLSIGLIAPILSLGRQGYRFGLCGIIKNQPRTSHLFRKCSNIVRSLLDQAKR